ncbi:hypothetical protein HK102_004562, partial [Quaeritorhiza haematococci]
MKLQKLLSDLKSHPALSAPSHKIGGDTTDPNPAVTSNKENEQVGRVLKIRALLERMGWLREDHSHQQEQEPQRVHRTQKGVAMKDVVVECVGEWMSQACENP